MATYPGFIGSSNRVRSVNVNAERTINWYTEKTTGHAKTPEWLAPTPGLEPFTVLQSGPIRALFAMDGRAFAVGGTGFYELFASGTSILRGSVNQNAFPATISSNGANGNQLLVTSAGINWLYSLTANTFDLIDITNPPTPTRMSTFSDGYFIALKANTNQFNISALYDGLTWDPLDVFQVSTVADQVVALVENHRDLWLLGSQTSSVWSNTGDEVVYAPIPGVKIDQGCAAAFSAVRIDNAVMWLGQSEVGAKVVWRADGYTPRRVSTHAVEFALAQAPRVDDAIAWVYQEEGHTFYVLYVPALAEVRGFGTTWVYDVATDAWHERALWDGTAMDWQPHPGRCHAYGFGHHLVGDRSSGAIYAMRLGLASDTLLIPGGTGGVGGGAAVPPTLMSVTPDTGAQGTTHAVTLIGTGFVVAGTTVAISGADVVVSDVIVSSTTQLAADVWIAPGASEGGRSVTVTTADGTSNTRPFVVTAAVVVPEAPTLTSVTPGTGTQGTAVAVALVGTGFVVGTTTVVVSGTGVTPSAVVVSSDTALTANLTVAAGAPVSARTVTVSTSAGTSGTQPFTVAASAAAGEREMLVASDLTFIGQQNLDHNYSNMALALRYVGGQRRFLMYTHADSEGIGDLIEYKENVAGLKNGVSHWTLGTVPTFTEVRRWRNWSTKDRIIAGSYPAIFTGDGGNGAWPSSFYWDEGHGCLWYTFQPVYPGGGTVWPAYSAVVLLDGEAIVAGDGSTAGRTVSDAQRKGPYYFKDAASATAWKTASSGLIPIPAERQAAMGAAYLNAGHHAANIGSDGPRSLSFWAHGALPSPPATNATILTDAVHLYDTGSASGATPPNVRMPNVQFQVGMHASNQTYWDVEGGTGTERQITNGATALRLTTNSFIYQHEYGDADCLAVYMNDTTAAGGAWVPEVYTASGWIVPTGWAMAAGNQQLSTVENVFYWPKVALVDVDPGTSMDAGHWVRLRQTGTGTNGGSVKALILTESKPTPTAYPDRPGDPSGTFSPTIAGAQYDASHYATMYEEMLWGGAWVRTPVVEGLAYVGPLKVGAQWYGGAPAWFQPVGGGVPVKHHYVAGENFSNGGKTEGPMSPFVFTFDPTKLVEMAQGTRDRNADGLQPEAYTDMVAQWPGILWYQHVNNAASPYYPAESFYTYGNGTSVVYDPVTQQLIVWLSHGAVWSGYGIVAFFQVRTA